MAYRKINALIWDDDWFVSLSDFDRMVWLAVLTGPQVRAIPGLMAATAATMSDYLRRSPVEVAAALARLERSGRVEVDQRARMLRVVNAPRWAVEHGEPENPNVIKGWWKAWRELPECDIKRRHLTPLREAYVIARDRAVANAADAEKAALRHELWEKTWSATFGSAAPARPSAPVVILGTFPALPDLDTVSGTVSETVPETVSQTVSETVPDTVSDTVCQTVSDTVTQTVPACARAFQEQEQEHKQEQEHAAAPARLATTPAGERVETVTAWLLRGDEIAAMDAAGTLDVRRCAKDMIVAGDVFVMGGKLRGDEVMERLQAAAADIGRETASAASTLQPMPPREVARKCRTFAAAALGKPRREWALRRPVAAFAPSGDQEDGAAAIDAFTAAWEAGKGASYLRPASDITKAATLAAQVRAAGGDPATFVRERALEYLADESDLLVGANHPFALFVSRVNQYGPPPAPAPAPRPLPEPPPPRPVRRMTVEQQRAFQDGLMEKLRAEEKAKAG